MSSHEHRRHHGHHHGGQMYTGKSVISYVLSVFVAISVLASFWGFTIKTGLFNTDIVVQSLNSSGYYKEKAESLTAGLKQLFADSGISGEAADGIITDRMVVLDTNAYLDAVIAGKTPDYDTKGLRDALTDKIGKYIADSGIAADDTLNAYVERLADRAVADYESNITVPFMAYFMDKVGEYDRAVDMLMLIPVPFALVCLGLLLLLHRMKYRGIRYFGYGVCAASVMEIATSLIMKRSFLGVLEGEGVYYDFVRLYVSSAMKQGMFCALAGFVLFGIILIITYYCRKKAI